MKYKNVRKVVRVGNASAVILPVKIMREMDVQQGDYVRLDKITKVKIKIENVEEPSRQRKLPSQQEVKK